MQWHHCPNMITKHNTQCTQSISRVVTCPPRLQHRPRHLVVLNSSSTNGNGNGNGSGNGSGGESTVPFSTISQAPTKQPYNWTFDSTKPAKPDPKVQDIPVASIRRPLGRTRSNDQAKVEALMKSITEIGLQEPIDVLLVDGQYYGFSGCHRFEAHQRLGLPTIKCRVRKANKQVLKMHMM